MPDNGLGFYDAAVAVTEEALNTHFQQLFDTQAISQRLDIVVDADHGKYLRGVMGAPVLSFLPNSSIS